MNRTRWIILIILIFILTACVALLTGPSNKGEESSGTTEAAASTAGDTSEPEDMLSTQPSETEPPETEPPVKTPDLTQERLDEILNAVMQENTATSVSVAAVEDGKLTVSSAWGWAVKNEREMTPDTKVRVASLSKLSLGLCAMAMAEDGLVDLDAPLSTYWGDAVRNPYSKGPVTISTLMTHTSSLTDQGAQGGLANLRGRLQSASSYRSMEPGDGGYWYYSNFGFSVLGTTLELASNQVLDQYLHTRFLDPMGIRASLFCGNLEENELATLYNAAGGVERTAATQASLNVPSNIGDGAIYYPGGLTISAPDLAKLIAILANDGVYEGVEYLKPESVENMETVRFTALDTCTFGQALVLCHQDNLMGRKSIYYHTGSAYGVFSLYSYDPDTGDGVVVITVGAPRAVDDRGLYTLCSTISEKLYTEMAGGAGIEVSPGAAGSVEVTESPSTASSGA